MVSPIERARVVWFVAAACACVCAVAGCGEEGGGRGRGTSQQGNAQVGGAVVSTVNGHPITVDDVQALTRASSLTAKEALARLQAEQLLMAEAERRGVGGGQVEQVAQRASVQALLDQETAKVVPTQSELREAYEKDARFHVPETRKSVHVLARANEKATPEQAQAAHAVARKVIEELRTMEWSAVKARYASVTIDGVQVKAEDLPAAVRDSGLVKEFADALFSLSEPGVVPEPVRTRFGWHAVRVIEIAAPRETPYEEAVTVLREELTHEKRVDHVSSLLVDLRQSNPVTVVPDVNDKLSQVDGAETFRKR